MKEVITYIISLITFCALFTSCADDYFNEPESDSSVTMKLLLSLPGGSATTRTTTDKGLEIESTININDLHVLVFENGVLSEEIKKVELEEVETGIRILKATTEKGYKNAIEVVVLTNIYKNNGSIGDNYHGESKATIYQSLIYTYGTKAWDVNQKPIPMWGAFLLTPRNAVNTATVNMYRALSKMNVFVNTDKVNNFTLTSVHVYYAYDRGYSAPLAQPTAPDPVSNPSIGSDFEQMNLASPLVYTCAAEETSMENQIYVPESNNSSLSAGKKALCLVIGGVYTGDGLVESGKPSYYRVDLKDKETKKAYDVLRNYLYNFTINSVSNPGTTTPEEALENAVVGLDVTIEAWNDITLRSIADQYSLITDKSRVNFDVEVESPEEVTVFSDYGDNWEIEGEGTSEDKKSWFTVVRNGNTLSISTTSNYGASRNGSFYIKVGKLKKQIIVEQAQPGTANCYLVGPGTHKISVVVKGNGSFGLTAESKSGSKVELDQSAELAPAYLSVIWETEKGLIQLIDAETGKPTQAKAKYNTTYGQLTYIIKDNPQAAGLVGGNGLIGAFNEAGEVIWSWHIWVCPDMLTTKSSNDETWSLTGYKVMDRNLGALSNQPGIGSLGLLYQWGRKDPLIGAAKISDDSDKMYTHNLLDNHGWEVATNAPSNKTVSYTVKNPTKMIHDGLSTGEKGPFLWGTDAGLAQEGIKELGRKTIYDPCPVGYRVPPVDAFVFKGTVEYTVEDGSTPKLKQEDIVKINSIQKEYPKSWDGPYTEEQEKGPLGAFVKIALNPTGGVWVWIENLEPKFYPNGYKIPYGVKFKVTRNIDTYILRKSSESKNWSENLVYIPNNIYADKMPAIQWSLEDYLHFSSAEYVANAPYYGYYVNYKEVKVPEMESKNDFYTLKDKTNLSWLPLSGAYDPKLGFTFKGVTIEQGPSLTVNSFIWTNSSVKSTNNEVRPAALFLHGANPKNLNDGRHIHGLNKIDIKAEPRYAGAVRCVRDEKKDFGDDNKVPTEINLDATKGNIVKSQVIAINESWRVVNPGAPWVKISPDRAPADKGKGTEITFTATQDHNSESERKTTVQIQIGSRTYNITVAQKSK